MIFIMPSLALRLTIKQYSNFYLDTIIEFCATLISATQNDIKLYKKYKMGSNGVARFNIFKKESSKNNLK